jgi:parallel beta-helix repeat protein
MAFLAIGLAGGLLTVHSRAAGPGQSFTFLHADFSQTLIGVTTNLLTGDIDEDGVPDGILGGVAFAGDGDPLVTECEFWGTRLHRYDLQGTPVTVNGTDLAPETVLDSAGGCGVVNHPDGTLYVAMNDFTGVGIANVDRETGALIGFMGPASNSLGIAVDPQTNDLVYAAEDCRFTGTCTFIRLNTTTGTPTTFATLAAADAEFVDGMYFDPSGEYLFLANRFPVFRLTILNRAGAVVQHVPMDSEPDGVAFHGTSPKFVVTNNTDGTMTRFDFPGDDYTQMPTVSVFASGGYRGDLSQVGPDGCIYLTQKGVRYNDGTESSFLDPDNSVVKICGGFVPPPGVPGEPNEPEPTGTITGTVFHDLDRDGVRDSGEPGIGGVTVTLTLPNASTATTTTAGDGSYLFGTLPAGDHAVSAPPAAAGKALFTPSPLNVTLAVGETRTGIDFGYVTGSIAGSAYVDANHNGTFDLGEAGLGGVTITLAGAAGDTVLTNPDGSYTFTGLDAGDYTVSAPTTAADYNLSTSSPVGVSLAPGEERTQVNFGYANGSISGFAYADDNGNGQMDPGESGIADVTITLTGTESGSTTTGANGSYFFTGLLAGSYSVSAPATAGTRVLTTTSPLVVTLGVGGSVPDVNFGYQADEGEPEPPEGPFCEKASVQSVLHPSTGRFPGNAGPDVLVQVHKGGSIQEAIAGAADTNEDGYLIVAVVAKDNGQLGGSTSQSVSITRSYQLPFGLIACSVTLQDPTPGDGMPAGHIAPEASAPAPQGGAGNVFVMDLHASNSSVAGWKVEGNGRYLRNVDTSGNATGFWLAGNSNTIHNGSAEENGTGLLVEGDGNQIMDADFMDNTGHGIHVIGANNLLDGNDVGDVGKGNGGDGIRVSGNGNDLIENDAFVNASTGILVTGSGNLLDKNRAGDGGKGNGGDGIRVEGAGNTVSNNTAHANAGDGIEISGGTSGSPNVLKKNKAGDRNKGNQGNGILIASGAGNGGSNPVEIDENTVKGNTLAGIKVAGTGHQLKKNTSGGTGSGDNNGDCEFDVSAGNVNATGNKANGSTIPGSNGSPFPTGCSGTP